MDRSLQRGTAHRVRGARLRGPVVTGGWMVLSVAGYSQFSGRDVHPVKDFAVGATVAAADTDTVTAYRVATTAFAEAFGPVSLAGGLLTDELRAPLSGPGRSRHGLGYTLEGMAGGDGGWPYSSKYPWRRLSWNDMRTLPERWDPGDTAVENLSGASQEYLLDEPYVALQRARAILGAALDETAHDISAGADPAAVNGKRSVVYALEGYTEILLADLFCSGIPLDTVREPLTQMVDKDGRSMYLDAIAHDKIMYSSSSGSTTQQVYRDAIAKFDTALRLAGTNAHPLNLARVGKGRAWLALGEYDSAAVAVAQVPQGFAYAVRSFLNLDPDGDEDLATVSDREGRNGLPYLSSGDPRTATDLVPSDKGMGTFRFPAKFWPDSDRAVHQREWTASSNGFKERLIAWAKASHVTLASTDTSIEYEPWQDDWPFTIASWEEAVLIRAEAALHRQGHTTHRQVDTSTWLHLLNVLRATAPIPGTAKPNPVRLPPLKDPGNAHDRIVLLFAERAYWLFLTGHRQGDLRRLVREYHWPQAQVYPTGPYLVSKELLPQVGEYGQDVNLPIPPVELLNPAFLGCIDRGA